jgi:polyisoprenoid-binding protein YceI
MKKLSYVLVLILTLSGLTLIAQSDLPKPGKYKIVAEESRIEAKTGSSGLLGFAGHAHVISPSSFTGEVELQADGKTATVNLQIQSPSLKETADFEQKEKQEIETQLHDSVLETAKYPEISFQSTSVKLSEGAGHVIDAQIEGNMSLHGITQPPGLQNRNEVCRWRNCESCKDHRYQFRIRAETSVNQLLYRAPA